MPENKEVEKENSSQSVTSYGAKSTGFITVATAILTHVQTFAEMGLTAVGMMFVAILGFGFLAYLDRLDANDSILAKWWLNGIEKNKGKED